MQHKMNNFNNNNNNNKHKKIKRMKNQKNLSQKMDIILIIIQICGKNCKKKTWFYFIHSLYIIKEKFLIQQQRTTNKNSYNNK